MCPKKPKKTKKSSQKVNDDAGEPAQPSGVLSTQESVIMTQNNPYEMVLSLVFSYLNSITYALKYEF